MNEKKVDICIIGGGASGLTAAITAARNSSESVMVIEKKDMAGKKIIASGNGRCNLSNSQIPSSKETLEFFSTLGLFTMEESEGRMYPYSEDSKDVVRALVNECENLGVEIITKACVESVERCDGGFNVSCNKLVVRCKKLLIATGGKAAPKLGTVGDGYNFAKKLGHKVTKLVPVLTAIDTEPRPGELMLKGVRAKAIVKLIYKEKEVFSEVGEVQFTADGLSGICIFNMSRFLLVPEGKSYKDGFTDYKICLDLAPDFNKEELAEIFGKQGLKDASDKLNSLVKRPLANLISEGTNSDSDLAARVKCLQFQPVGAKGWDFAQVTKGGVSLEEIDEKTGESLLIPGLFFAGEVLDYDGPCGGYNLENAWKTGIKCGKGMTK